MNIFYVLGSLLLIEGALLTLPVIVALLCGEHVFFPTIISSTIAFFIGGLLWYFNRNCSKQINKREGFVIVSTVWIMYAFFGALPFVLSGSMTSMTDAFFEAMSGFTTTGYTILTDIETLPRSLLFWRSFMNFTGGIGILVMCISVLPNFGVGSMNIYQAESTASISQKTSPRIKDTAKNISVIYIILTALCILFYLPDMEIFDAVCYAFSTTATGGFSTKNAGLGAFSDYSQWVAIVFMIFGSTSFILFFYVWKREFKRITKNEEFRFFMLIILIASIIIGAELLLNGYEIGQAVREALFNVANIVSTTGFTINDYKFWTPPLWFIVFLLAFVGGCAGSTAGGMKIVRFILLIKMIPVHFKKMMHQNAVIQVKLNRQNVSEDRMYRTLSFFMIFLCVYTAGVFALMVCGFNFNTAAAAAIGCLANLGSGLELTEHIDSFAGVSSPISKWICSFLMLSGRLELYSVLILFSPAFWRKQ